MRNAKSMLDSKSGGTWWEGVDQAADQVCWGCEQEPWPNERSYGHQIWNAIHQANLPIRQVAARTNLWSVPCPRGIERRGRGTRCLIGHYVYGIMCFFKWMGEPGQENFALTNLESVMDLAPIVQKSPCKDDWAFPVAEVSENYERILTLVWHLHVPVPDHWMPASGPLRCKRDRAREPQERPQLEPDGLKRVTGVNGVNGVNGANIQCLVLTIFPQEVERMQMISETYAKYCDSLTFFISSPFAPPSHFRGYRIINLRDVFDISLDSQPTDQPTASSKPTEPNTIEKMFAAFRFAGLFMEGAMPDVVCRLDSDTLFLPPNLRRILACRNFSASELWAIGRENYGHKHEQPGRVFLNGGTGICLSREAVQLLSKEMELGRFVRTTSSGAWNSGECVVAPGHWDDVAQFHLAVFAGRYFRECHTKVNLTDDLKAPHPALVVQQLKLQCIVYIHTSIHQYIHTSIHPSIHTSMHTYRHTHTPTHTHTHTYTHLHTHTYHIHIHIHRHTYTCIYTYPYIPIQIHAYPLIGMDACMHTYIPFTAFIPIIHSYIHTFMHSYIHTFIHSYIHTFICFYMPTFRRSYVHT